MVLKKKSVRDIPVSQRKVLMRVDFNVPFDAVTGAISDDTRIRASVPTITYLLENQAAVILCSHLGRPKGRDSRDSLRPTAECLSTLLQRPVAFVDDCLGPPVQQAAARLQPGELLVLENLRFHPEEEKNDEAFARALASLADLFVNDAFGVCHRAHASTVGVTKFLPAVAGFLVERELEFLGKALYDPARPLGAILGGAKVSDKLQVLEHLLERVDYLLVGGGMAATFLKAMGYGIGKSLAEEDKLDFAKGLQQKAKQRGVRFLLPEDLVVAEAFAGEARHRTVPLDQIPDGWYIMDIGPKTVARFREALRHCRTVIWNGPQGVFEMEPFSQGTRALARALAELKATTIVGGGSTAEAVLQLGLSEKMSHVSTGGGASLEFLEGRTLPGVAALADKDL
jgi:phosphoglycerate kinase